MPSPLDNIIRELTELITHLHEFLLDTESSQERPGWNQQLEQYTRKTLLIRLLAGQGNRIGLHDACMQQQDNLRALVKRGVIPAPHEWDRLERWPLLLLSCLTTPVLEAAVNELIAYFRNNNSAVPFSEHDAQALRTNLLTPVRMPQAANENNIFKLPVEYKQAPLDHATSPEATLRYLLQHELLDTVTEYLGVADLPATTVVEHAQALRLCADRIQLLGISAAGSDLIGLMDCCMLCHGALIKRLDAHSQLSATGREQLKIWTGLISRYLDRPDSAEVVDALLDFYQRGHFIPAMLKCEYVSLREFLLIDTAAQITPRIEIKAVPEPTPLSRDDSHRVDSTQRGEKVAQWVSPTAQIVTMPLPQVPESVPAPEVKPPVIMLPVQANIIDDLLRLAGESIVMTGQLQERLRLSLRQSKMGAEQNIMLQQLLNELEQCAVDSHHAELPGITRRIMEAAARARENSRQLEDHLAVCGELLPALVRVNKDNQEAVLRTRMVPVSSIVPRLQRSVRQACGATGKRVNLTVSGADTLLDSDMLDNLSDSLLHLLSNALDHGIEPVELRRVASKPEIGTIELSFARDGDDLVVRCCDDGNGLDYARIKQVAAQKGLIDPGKQLSDAELNRMILLPGFTTRTENAPSPESDIGLDTVYSRVVRMKGTLSITSQAQRGCVVELRIPLSVVSIHALMVQSKTQVLAISSRCVEQILYVGAGQVHADGNCLQYRVGEETYDACELEQLLHLPVDRRWLERADRPALLVRDSTGHLRAVFVEQVLASQDLIVKPLGPYLPTILGIEGATILGNGDVAAVIDLRGLLQTMQPVQAGHVENPV